MPRSVTPPAPIAILTDFGYRDHYVGVMKGVIARIAPAAPLVDLTHGIPAQSIVAGAIALRESWRFFPARTVFLVVVDPGVGTQRKAIAIETAAGARFVGPDNGVLSLAAAEAGIGRIVHLASPRYQLPALSSTFHGRDIFAPAAAWLWRGAKIDALGPRISKLERVKLPSPAISARRIRGEVIYVDGFGNLVSNISRDSVARLQACFPGKSLSIRIKKSAAMPILNAYGDARLNAPLATFGSFDLLEIAVRDASAAARFKAGAGSPVVVSTDRV
jgi:S-adenosyl-L-methionine hydrolase (adenosine-forming)